MFTGIHPRPCEVFYGRGTLPTLVESSDMESLFKELDYLDIDYAASKFEYVPIDDLN